MSMIMRDGVSLMTNLTIEARNVRTGEIQRQEIANLTLTSGLNLIRDWAAGDAPAGISHFAVGTDGSAKDKSDPGLKTEVFRDAITQMTKGTGTLTLKYYLATGSANGHTLREAGLVNASSGGTFYAVSVMDSIEKTALIEVTFTWVLTWTSV